MAAILFFFLVLCAHERKLCGTTLAMYVVNVEMTIAGPLSGQTLRYCLWIHLKDARSIDLPLCVPIRVNKPMRYDMLTPLYS